MSDEIQEAIRTLRDAGFTSVDFLGPQSDLVRNSAGQAQSEGDEGEHQPARSAEGIGDVRKKGLSFRSTARKTPRDVRQRGLSFVQQARDVGPNDQEVGA